VIRMRQDQEVAGRELHITTTALMLSLIWYRVRMTDHRLTAVCDILVMKLVYNAYPFIPSLSRIYD